MTTSKYAFLALTLLLVPAAGCSSSTTTPTTTTSEAGTTDAATSDAATQSDAGGGDAKPTDVCAEVANVGGQVMKDHDPGPPPAMTGGAIVDGTYVLTKMVQYNGENGQLAHQETMVFANGNGQIVGTESGSTKRLFFTYTTSGNEITMVISCGGPAGSNVQKYTATATTFVSVNSGDANELHTFTKQ
ncbi:MAG: hypothetical protein JWM74_5432 [Myxococcaceae bacterium]|nr:hypothetical protein [Myxococcaceae bacterium]